MGVHVCECVWVCVCVSACAHVRVHTCVCSILIGHRVTIERGGGVSGGAKKGYERGIFFR